MEHKFISLICADCGKFHDVPVYCGDRFCPICSVARRMRVRNRLDALVKLVKPEHAYGIKHLTLTIKNMQNLSLMTSAIQKSFKDLRKTKSWKFHVKGGASVIEVTGSPGNWHVHLHIVIEARYYPWEEILKLWMKVSTGRGVWINDLQKHKISGYLTKYLSKTAVSIDARDELNSALKGTRLFQPFGSWFALSRIYKKPKMSCKECQGTCLILYSDCFDDVSGFYMKEVDINSP